MSSMKDAIVVGCGIIGATITKALRERGLNVLCLDDRSKLSGTAPSGGHLKPSWFGGISKERSSAAMELLEETWGFTTQEFHILPDDKKTTVHRVDTDAVMAYREKHSLNAKVTHLEHLTNVPLVGYTTHHGLMYEYRTKLLVLAAGVGTSSLLSGIGERLKVTGKMGVSFRMACQVSKPFIKPWAPYKQIVAHNQTAKEIWIGDGTAILEKNWTDDHILASKHRCLEALGSGPPEVLKTLVGIRPYAAHPKEDPCLIRTLGKHTWIVTGSGKAGTISAGTATRRIIDAIV